eukprot:TRINITY_DN9517_c0_g1_i2.p1 TRINITY_DN9517_c0_g1~~TRINITY_DN9517_c0_g1_i2.p1  ORF type:complete len:206 (-),score=9.49 TRINITY_DN9517_c0_g1_i2:9-626(-)
MRESQLPTGTRRRRVVKTVDWIAFACWALTSSAGCYGFYLGFDTRETGGPLVCQREGDGCAALGGHKAVCDACHRSQFDFVQVLISFYMVVFGLMGLLFACGAPVVRDEFAFLRSRFGRGFFMFFIGTLAVAQGVNFTYVQSLTLAVGCVDTAVGAFLMLSYSCVSSGQLYAKQAGKGGANVTCLQDACEPGQPRLTSGRTDSHS